MTTNKMEKLTFGEIVLLKFPLTDGEAHKKRPALVILDTEDNDIIVCRITSKIYETKFDFKINDWTEAGLKLPSVIRLHKIASLDKKLIDKKLGEVNQTLRKKIKNTFNRIID